MARLLLACLACLVTGPLALAPAAAQAPSASQTTLRCDSRLVSAGDLDLVLRERCGEPFHSELWVERHAERRGEELAVSRDIRFEDWYYDFGPNRFLVRARLRDGRLVDVEMLPMRGRAQAPRGCAHQQLRSGMSTGEVIALCGAPTQRDVLGEAMHIGTSPAESILPLRRERWIYLPSSARPLVLMVERGRVGQVIVE